MQLAGRLVAIAIVVGINDRGIIRLMPVKNGGHAAYTLAGDPLYDWVTTDTEADRRLPDGSLHHASPILLAGRAILLQLAGVRLVGGLRRRRARRVYVRMFSDRSPRQLVTLLQQNHIAYVAIVTRSRRGSGDMVKRERGRVQGPLRAGLRRSGQAVRGAHNLQGAHRPDSGAALPDRPRSLHRRRRQSR